MTIGNDQRYYVPPQALQYTGKPMPGGAALPASMYSRYYQPPQAPWSYPVKQTTGYSFQPTAYSRSYVPVQSGGPFASKLAGLGDDTTVTAAVPAKGFTDGLTIWTSPTNAIAAIQGIVTSPSSAFSSSAAAYSVGVLLPPVVLLMLIFGGRR